MAGEQRRFEVVLPIEAQHMLDDLRTQLASHAVSDTALVNKATLVGLYYASVDRGAADAMQWSIDKLAMHLLGALRAHDARADGGGSGE